MDPSFPHLSSSPQPPSQPQPKTQHLSSLLSQLQRVPSPASIHLPTSPAPPASFVPPTQQERSLDDLFRGLNGAGSAGSAMGGGNAGSGEARASQLLSIFSQPSPNYPSAGGFSGGGHYEGQQQSSLPLQQQQPGGGGDQSLLHLMLAGMASPPPDQQEHHQQLPPALARPEPSPAPSTSFPPPPAFQQIASSDDVNMASPALPAPASQPEQPSLPQNQSMPSELASKFHFFSPFDAFPSPKKKTSSSIRAPSSIPPAAAGIASSVSRTASFSGVQVQAHDNATAGGLAPSVTIEQSSAVAPKLEREDSNAPPPTRSINDDIFGHSSSSTTKLAPNLFPTTLLPPTPPLPPVSSSSSFPTFPSDMNPIVSPPSRIISPPLSQSRSHTPSMSISASSQLLAQLNNSSTHSSPTAISGVKPAPSPAFGHTRSASGNLRLAARGEVVTGGRFAACRFLQEAQAQGLVSSSASPSRARKLVVGERDVVTVRVDESGLEGIVKDEGALQKKPITLIKSDLLFSAGKTIGSGGVISYAMNKGRVRLIDEVTGARALLKLPADWFHRDSQVADLAVETGLVAAVTTDGGLVVWRLPTVWKEDDPPCPVIYAVFAPPPSSSDDARLKLVRFHHTDTLALVSGPYVLLLNLPRVSAAWLEDNKQNAEYPLPTSRAQLQQDALALEIDNGTVASFDIRDSSDALSQDVLIVGKNKGEVRMYSVWEAAGSTSGRKESAERYRGYLAGPSGDVTSVHFAGREMVVVGSARGTFFQAFPLTGGLSVKPVSELRFEGESGAFGKAEWDENRSLLWISNTSRSSLYAARLIFPSSSSPPSSNIFHSLAEFPLDPALTSFSISLPSASTDFQCFTVSPMGIDQLVISQPTLDNLFPSSSTVEPASADSNATQAASASTDDVEAHLLAPTPPSEPSTPVEPNPAEALPPSAEADIVPDALEIKQEPVEDAPIPPAPPTTVAVAAAQPEQESIPAAADIKPVNEEKKATTSRKVESSERERKRTQSSRSSVKYEIKEDGVIGGGGEKVDVGAIGAKLQRQTKESEEAVIAKVTSLLEQQSARLEANDLRRQETVFKLLSSELKSNTTSVVVGAVKQEIKDSVLPVISQVVKAELGEMMSGEISKGLVDSMRSSLPSELERHLNSRAFASVVFPSIEKAIKEIVQKTLVPSYAEAVSKLQESVSEEIRADMVDIRKEIVSEQSNSLIQTTETVAQLSSTITSLSTQLSDLSSLVQSLQAQLQQQQQQQQQQPAQPSQREQASTPRAATPVLPLPPSTTSVASSLPSVTMGAGGSHPIALQPAYSAYPPQPLPQQSQSQQQPQQLQPTAYLSPPPSAPQSTILSEPSYLPSSSGPSDPYPQQRQEQHARHYSTSSGSNMNVAPQGYSPLPPHQQQQQQQQAVGPTQPDWEEFFTEQFMSRDPSALTRVIARLAEPTVLDQVLPKPNAANGSGETCLLSQAVLLTTVHKFTDLASKNPVTSPLLPPSLLIIQRAARLLVPRDPSILPYSSRVVTLVLQLLGRLEEVLIQQHHQQQATRGQGAYSFGELESMVKLLRSARADLEMGKWK